MLALDALNALINHTFYDQRILWGIPIAAVILFIILFKEWVKLDPHEEKATKRRRVWLFISRLLLISLLLIALAGPYGETTHEVKGNPRVTLLLDQSGSMEYLDTAFTENLASSLEGKVATRIRQFGTVTVSDVGSAILQNLEPGNNILLISDGNANLGADLESVAFYAATINATISMINLSEKTYEAAVTITGPGKVVSESDATYTITVSSTDKTRAVPVSVTIDGANVLNKEVYPGETSFTRQFAKGEHRIEARIQPGDANVQNNIYYKTVSVLPKPRILLVTSSSTPLELLLRELYDVEKRTSLPQDLSPYYAIVLNDAPIENIRYTDSLHNFLIDESGGYYGGGLVLFGGFNSYDRGGYSSSSLEPMLPVKVGKGERKKSQSSLVFIIDVSGSTTKTKYHLIDGAWVAKDDAVPTLDVIKAQVVSIVEQLKLDNKVGIILFGVPSIGDHASVEEAISDTVQVMAPLDYLYNNRKDIIEKAPRIQGGGPTAADVALSGAVEMLKYEKGDKNIILLTDGRYSAGLGAESPMKKELLNLAANAKKRYGINFMTIGVGTQVDTEFAQKVDEPFLKQLAAAGDGTYDRATRLHSLLIKWGDPKAKEFGEEFILVPLSLSHFITRGVEPTATLNGYNEVVPKDTAELLIAADSGVPALTTWRYGNGRVATWSVFAGNNLGQLLNAENSILLSRTVNWAIGDPQRKEAYYVDIKDVRTNEEGTVSVKSKSPVTSEALDFTKQGDLYTARFSSVEAGFNTILGQPYATNRPSEYDYIGVDLGLEETVFSTGGKTFKPSDEQAIVDFIKEASKRVTVERRGLAFPFILLAALLFLLEILIRRINQRRYTR